MSFFGCGACTKTRITDSIDNPPQDRSQSGRDIKVNVIDVKKQTADMAALDMAMQSVYNVTSVEPDTEAYDLLLVIGKGCFESATVHLAQHKSSGSLLAVKRVLMDKYVMDLPMLHHELMCHRTLRHPNLLPSLMSSFVTGSELWTVFPLMGYGSCRDLLHAHFMEGLPEQAIAIILHEVLCGLQYMHSRALIHRAVKASHILVSHTGHVALSGFHHVLPMLDNARRAMKMHDFPNKHFAECLLWASPELLEQNLAGYDTKSDIYSVGILSCELANGVVPFADMPSTQMLLEKMEGTTPRLLDSTTLPPEVLANEDGVQDQSLPFQRTFSQHFHAIVEACLQTQPQLRPTAGALMQHSFFRPVRRNRPGSTGAIADVSLLPELLKPVTPLNTMDLTALAQESSGAKAKKASLAVEEVTDDIAQITVDDWVF